MASTFTNLLYHLVFSTKDRAPRIVEPVRDRLYEYIGGILRGEGGSLLAAGGMRKGASKRRSGIVVGISR